MLYIKTVIGLLPENHRVIVCPGKIVVTHEECKDEFMKNRHPQASRRMAFGLDSFSLHERNHFGQSVRIAMACMDGKIVPRLSKTRQCDLPSELPGISRRLRTMSRDLTAHQADQIELLLRFDELEGWRESGALHCAAWMNQELGISLQLGWEYLRVGRLLRSLPTIKALFRNGSLSWSKVRLLSRVADEETECAMCHCALDASVSDVERLCTEYRWKKGAGGKGSEDENDRSLQQYNARSLTWRENHIGNTEIRLCLQPEVAQAFLCCLEQAMTLLVEPQVSELPEKQAGSGSFVEKTDYTMRQRRADAAILMAENGLQNTGREMATADRYQVLVSVEASELREDTDCGSYSSTDPSTDPCTDPSSCSGTGQGIGVDPRPHNRTNKDKSRKTHKPCGDHTPGRRARLPGGVVIGRETARRIACDCTVSCIANLLGEPVDIGRKTRMWTPAMARAIKSRDQHCQFPGCTATRHLHIHHIKHWADGGTTCIENGVCLCTRHHMLVHEGGLRIEKISGNESRVQKQFLMQKDVDSDGADSALSDRGVHGNTCPETSAETLLRNNRISFDFVRKVLPTRYRFRVVDRSGQDVRRVGFTSNRSNRSTCVEWLEGLSDNAGSFGQSENRCKGDSCDPPDACMEMQGIYEVNHCR